MKNMICGSKKASKGEIGGSVSSTKTSPLQSESKQNREEQGEPVAGSRKEAGPGGEAELL